LPGIERDAAAEAPAARDAAQHHVGVGDGGLGAAEAVCRRARDEPALRGPTWRLPSTSSQAMEPPPAPTVCMSICGTLTGKAPTMLSDVITGVRSRTRQTSVDVPPMS
jgi:hypothetical protein